jgi:hypothetical protein
MRIDAAGHTSFAAPGEPPAYDVHCRASFGRHHEPLLGGGPAGDPPATNSHEALAGVLRPGNAGANTAADHVEIVEIVELVLEQLPREVVETAQIIVRTDSAAATHELCDELRAIRVNFLMGYEGHCCGRRGTARRRAELLKCGAV